MSKQFYFKQFSLAEVHSFNVKIVLFQTIQFSINTQFSSIWPIDRTLSSATTPGQSGRGSDSNEGVFCIPRSSSINGTSLWDCLVSYPGLLFMVAQSGGGCRIHWMRSTPSLPLLPGPLWPGVAAPDRALSMGWIELTAYLC